MDDLSSAKTYGGIGAILLLLTFIPFIGFILGIVGLILVFLAVKQIADITKDNELFTNYLYSFILTIIAAVAAILIILVSIGLAGGFAWLTSLGTSGYTDPGAFLATFGTFIGGIILALIVGWVLIIFSAIYLRKSYNKIAKHTHVEMFRTTGLVYFIGAITTIILIGFLILLIARILEIVAYFSLPDTLPGEKPDEKTHRHCPHCDRHIPEDANTCPYCSKKLT